MSIVDALSATLGNNNELRATAERQLREFEEKDICGFMRSLIPVFSDEKLPQEIRQSAGINLKNAISQNGDKKRRWVTLPGELKLEMHHLCIAMLESSSEQVRHVAAQLTNAIALIELPRGEWKDIIDVLCNKSLNQSNEGLFESSLMTIGFICQEIDPVEIAEHSDNLLTVIIKGVSDANPKIKAIGLDALTNACKFINKNFLNKAERDYIMGVILNSANPANPPSVLEKTFECLGEIVDFYYDKLPEYIVAIFNVSRPNFAHEDDDVVKAVCSLWMIIADIEYQYIEDGDASSSLNIIKQAAPNLVPLLVTCMQRQDEDQEQDDWNAATSAATCLDSVALCTGDAIWGIIFPFIQQNITSNEWHKCEAATFALGCIVKEENATNPEIRRALSTVLPLLLGHTTNQMVLVRETTLFTISRVVESVPDVIAPSVDQVMGALLSRLKDEPRIVVMACEGVMDVICALGAAEQGSALSAIKSEKLNAYFTPAVKEMIGVCQRPDAQKNSMKEKAVEVMSCVIENAPDALLNLVKQLLPEYMGQLAAALKNPSQKDVLSPFLVVIKSCVDRLRGELVSVPNFSIDQLMGLAVQAMMVADAYTEALALVSSVADLIEKDMGKYFPAIKPIIVAALQNTSAYETCAFTVTVLGGICNAMGAAVLPYCDELVSILLTALKDPTLNRSVKPPIFQAFGDVAMAIGNNFARYYAPFAEMMSAAKNAALVKGDSEDMEEFLSELCTGLLTCFSSVILSVQIPNIEVLGKDAIEFAVRCYEIRGRRAPGVAKGVVSLFGDVARQIGAPLAAYLTSQSVFSIVQDVSVSPDSDDDTISVAKWAMDEIKRFVQKV